MPARSWWSARPPSPSTCAAEGMLSYPPMPSPATNPSWRGSVAVPSWGSATATTSSASSSSAPRRARVPFRSARPSWPSRAPSRSRPRTEDHTLVNIAMLLELAAGGDPERTVLGSQDGGMSAAELLERSRRAAVYFEKSGTEVVGYFGLNSEVLPVALFGAALAGVPFSPINYRAPDEQLRGILGRGAGGLT